MQMTNEFRRKGLWKPDPFRPHCFDRDGRTAWFRKLHIALNLQRNRSSVLKHQHPVSNSGLLSVDAVSHDQCFTQLSAETLQPAEITSRRTSDYVHLSVGEGHQDSKRSSPDHRPVVVDIETMTLPSVRLVDVDSDTMHFVSTHQPNSSDNSNYLFHFRSFAEENRPVEIPCTILPMRRYASEPSPTQDPSPSPVFFFATTNALLALPELQPVAHPLGALNRFSEKEFYTIEDARVLLRVALLKISNVKDRIQMTESVKESLLVRLESVEKNSYEVPSERLQILADELVEEKLLLVANFRGLIRKMEEVTHAPADTNESLLLRIPKLIRDLLMQLADSDAVSKKLSVDLQHARSQLAQSARLTLKQAHVVAEAKSNVASEHREVAMLQTAVTSLQTNIFILESEVEHLHDTILRAGL